MKKTKEMIEKWMHAIHTRDVETLVGLYDSEAVLIPTFSNKILNTSEKIRDYFEKLASREGLNIELHENTLIVQDLPAHMSALSGLYKWCFAVDGELLNFDARFTYVVDLSKASPIMQHHSSQIPRML